jgi:hypothetical protein
MVADFKSRRTILACPKIWSDLQVTNATTPMAPGVGSPKQFLNDDQSRAGAQWLILETKQWQFVKLAVYDWSARLSRMRSALGKLGLGDSRFTV